MYEISRLPNGLLVATASMPHMASISLGLWVGVGGRFEPAALCGVSHFIEHVLFKGTSRRSAKRISQDIEGLGGELNAFTAEENTCYFCKASHDRFDEVLDVLADMFLNSRFAPVEINKEREVIKEELAMYLDQPQHHVLELLNEILWPDHPLGRSLTGTPQTLEALRRQDLLRFLQAFYVSGNTLVVAAGQLEHRAIVRAVSGFSRALRIGQRLPFAPVRDLQQAPRIRFFSKATEQTQLAIGFRVCSRHDERRYALRLLNTILGENMSSRLFQVIREDRGLAYSVGSSLTLFDDVGVLTLSAGLDAENLAAVLKLIRRELKRLQEKAPGPGELRRARDYLVGQMDLSLESTSNQMMWIGEQVLGYGKILPPEAIRKQLAAVRPGEIRAAARDYLQPERLSLSLVSPLKKDPGLRRWLKA